MAQDERRTTVRRLAVATSLLAVGLSPLLPGSAQAVATPATVTFSGRILDYQAATGQSNHLTVTKDHEVIHENESEWGSATYTYVLDDTVAITADSDRCTYPESTDQTRVVCTWIYFYGRDGGRTGTFKLGDKNDTVTYVNPDGDTTNIDVFYLGAGDDTYTSPKYSEANAVLGEAGNDKITADHSFSLISGGAGNDTLRVKKGSANMDGDSGHDKLYSETGAQDLDGGSGNDLIHAGVGRDKLVGGKGNDTLYGEGGDDRIYGNSGNDKLYGGAGKDTLSGGPGKDVVKQ